MNADNKKPKLLEQTSALKGNTLRVYTSRACHPGCPYYVFKSNMLLHTTKIAPWAKRVDASVLNRQLTIKHVPKWQLINHQETVTA